MSPFLYKWLKLSLVSVVACGFLAMAVYAFIMRDEIRAAQIEPPLITVPEQPLKSRPDAPGGLEFPNQDKLVFDLLENTAAAPVAAITATAAEALNSPTLSGAAAASSFAPVATTPTQIVAEISPATKPVVKMPTLSPTQPVQVAPKPEPKPAEKATPQPEPKAAAQSAGSWSVQLAAVGSEADARTTAKQLQGKFGALKPLAVRIVPAPGGQRFRVQFTGLATRTAAQAVCDKLGSQPCFPVGK
jgi:cell division septation protein DedD